jgi:hypothetical protein
MGLTFYDPAPMPTNEEQREKTVRAANLLHIRNDPQLQSIVEQTRRAFGTAMAAVSIVYQDSHHCFGRVARWDI